MAEPMIGAGDDLAARLREQHRQRRAKFASFKEPPPKLAHVPARTGRVVYLVPRERLEAVRAAKRTAAMPRPPEPLPPGVVLDAIRAMRDYCDKDRLYDSRIRDGVRAEPWCEQAKTISLRTLATVVAKAHDLTLAELISSRRMTAITRARREYYWLAKRHTTFSLPQIGRAVGGKDHTTALHGIRRFNEQLAAGEDCRRVFLDHCCHVVSP